MDIVYLNKLLKQAVFKSDLLSVSELLDKGADASIRVSKDAGNLLHHTSCSEIASLLIKKGAKVNARNRFRMAPIYNAVRNGNHKLVRVLLMNGALTNVNNFKYILLHIATNLNDFEVVKLLIEYGCSVNKCDKHCFAPLHLALRNVNNIHLKLVRYLLEKGANVNSVCSDTQSYPIHLALKNKHCSSSVLKLLFDYGADINVLEGKNYNTVLHTAALNCDNVEIIEAILQQNPLNIMSYNFRCLNALQIAVQHCKLEVIQKIIMYCYQIDMNILENNIFIGSVNKLNSSKSGKYVNLMNGKGNLTILQMAFARRDFNIEIINELLQHGANIPEYSKDVYEIYEAFGLNVIKSLVKYSMMNPDFNVHIFMSLKSIPNIEDYIEKCRVELSLIVKEFSISSLCELFNFYEHLSMSILDKIMNICINKSNLFPIYSKVLLRRLQKSDFLELLGNCEMFAENKCSKNKIALDWASLCHIIEYLNDSDLCNFIFAFYQKHSLRDAKLV